VELFQFGYLMKRFRTGMSIGLLSSRALLVSLSVLSATVPAFAMDTDGQSAPSAADLRVAADRFDEGRAAFKVSAFAEAAEHFEAADSRAPSGSALVLAMRSHAQAGHFAKAATLAELVLVRDPENVEYVAQAQDVIASHVTEFGRITIECEPQCELVVDHKLVHGQAMKTWNVYTESGSHEVVAHFSEARHVNATTEVAAGQAVTLTLSPLVLPSPVAPPASMESVKPPSVSPLLPSDEKKRHGLSPTVFWIGVGATAVVGGVTIWSAIDTQINPGPELVKEECAGKTAADCPLYQKGEAKELRTNLLLGGTALLAVATAVTGIFATDFSGSSSARKQGAAGGRIRPTVSVGLGRSAWVGAEGRF
jgi:hypothetical protein